MTGPSPATRMLTVEGLDVAYGDFQVLWEAGLHVDAGEIVCVLGPNGAGKSTTIRMLTGLLAPSSGEARVAGYDIRTQPEAVKSANLDSWP